MTLSTTATRVQYSGNGSTKGFAFPYKFLENADLVVVLTSSAGVDTTQAITTHYTVTNTGVGGTVTMVTAPAVGETLTISRVVGLTQETDYIEGDDFPAETHEAALDKLTMIAQQHQDTLSRAITVPRTVATSFDGELTPEASKILGFNSSATAFQLYSQSEAGISDAANVSYTKNETGATERTVQAALNDQALCPLEFGAAGDGVTDDTTAVQACYTAAVASGKDVALRGKTYYTTLRIRVTGAVRTFGPGRIHRYIDYPESGACSGLNISYAAFTILGYPTGMPNVFPNVSRSVGGQGIMETTCAAATGADVLDQIIDIEAVNYGDKTVTCATPGDFDDVVAGEWVILVEGRGLGGGGNNYLSERQWFAQVESRTGDELTLTSPVLRDLDGRSFPDGTSIPTSYAVNGTDHRLYAYRVTFVEGVEFHNMDIRIETTAAADAGIAYAYTHVYHGKDVLFQNVNFIADEPATAGRDICNDQIADSINVRYINCTWPLGLGVTSFNRSAFGGMFNCYGPNISASPFEQGEGQYGVQYVDNTFFARAVGTGGYGVYLGNSKYCTFRGNIVVGSFTEDTWADPTAGYAVQLNDAEDCTVEGNQFFGFHYGIADTAATYGPDYPDAIAKRNVIQGNTFIAPPGVTTGTIGCQLYYPGSTDSIVANNTFIDYHQPFSTQLYSVAHKGNRYYGNVIRNPNVTIDATGGGPERYRQGAHGGFVGRWYIYDQDVTVDYFSSTAKTTIDVGEGYTFRSGWGANKPLMKLCTAGPGTLGTLNSGSTTGSISTGTADLVVSSATDLYAGCIITIAGVTGTFEVLWVDGTYARLDGNADATVAGAAVAYSPPTMITVPTACDYLADLNQTISGTYQQSEVQAISDKVDALLALMRSAGTMDAS